MTEINVGRIQTMFDIILGKTVGVLFFVVGGKES